MRMAAFSMSTVPETTGVMIRRSNGSQAASANWNSDETTMRLASMAGPPSASAVIEMAMKLGVVPEMNICPTPNRPIRTACRAVMPPLMISAAKTAHDRYLSP